MKISIVMPVYNAENYIEKSIKSVLQQSFEDWELIVCDDCSTDGTKDILNEFEDERISIIRTDCNSGAAFIPRKMAISVSHGDFIVCLDADDYFAPDYLEKMYSRIIETGASICCSQMIINEFRNSQVIETKKPKEGFDFDLAISGEEAYGLTVPEWKISLNGYMVRRNLWENALSRFKLEGKGIHDDECMGRCILLDADKVVFCHTNYYYLIHDQSVTHRFNGKIFDYIKAEKAMVSIIAKRYGKDNTLYEATCLGQLNAFISVFVQYVEQVEKGFNDGGYYFNRFKKEYGDIPWIVVSKYHRHYSLLKYDFSLFWMAYAIRYHTLALTNASVCLFLKFINNKILNNKYASWYIRRPQIERGIRRSLQMRREEERAIAVESNKRFDDYVISVFDGRVQCGGVADRLRGILTTYYICKKYSKKYKLYFVSPFDITDFLLPNQYDWTIGRDEICMIGGNYDIVVLATSDESGYQTHKQRLFLEKKISRSKKPILIHTNARCSYELGYSTLFNELFRLSDNLKRLVEKEKVAIGDEYISVSTRFLDLLDDFNEPNGYGEPLLTDDKEELLEKLIKHLELLYNKYKMRILVNSDSKTFLARANELEYTYVVPGDITHIDCEYRSNKDKAFEKVFVDFFMIANAKEIILLKSGMMMKSGFPYAASKIYNRPFSVVEI